MNELEEIKSKIDIVEYIGGYVQLKQTGRNFKACCPFHSEKTPSFVVSPERQMWHCFGACGEGGDIFSFAMKIEGLSFPEAVESLAAKAGVKIVRKNFEKSSSKSNSYSANELTENFYHDALMTDEGKKARDYIIKKRKLSVKTIEEFGLGYSPIQKSSLQNELNKHNLSTQEQQKAGLVTQKNGELRDFFWGRLMFPIRDISGRTVGFSARVLDDSLPKYINTPETEIFHKSDILYGIDLGKETIRKSDNAIVVEGMMDVIVSRQAGVKNVVAAGGTALTENQLRLLARLTKNLKLAFDVDFAGSVATRRAIELAWNLGFNLKVIEIPSGKDPADTASDSPEKWKEAVRGAIYVVDYLFESAFKHFDKKDPIGRKKIAAELLPVIKRIPDEIERNTYIKSLAEKLQVDESSINSALSKVGQPKESLKSERKTEFHPKNKQAELEGNVLGLLLIFPHYLDFASTVLEPNDFTDPIIGKKYEHVLKYYLKKGNFSEKAFLASLKKEEEDSFNLLMLSAEEQFSDLDEEKKAEEIYFGVKRIKKLSLDVKKQSLIAEISTLEKEKKKGEARKALKVLQTLLEEEKLIS